MSSWISDPAVSLVLLTLASVGIGGCEGREGEAKKAKITNGSKTSRVVIYSPPYGENARPPDSVTILWDGQEMFRGVLPIRTSGPDGMPVELLEIRDAPGEHVLEVQAGRLSQEQEVNLKDQDSRYYKLFGVKDGKEVLIEDLGANPRSL